ncbi:hypothetical protein ACHQM5_006872 [Ranunculus cassubicifolius]
MRRKSSHSAHLPPCYCSSCSSGHQNKCGNQATECAVSVCVLCISLPLTILWCVVKFPCKVCWKMGKHLVTSSSCNSRNNRVLSASSSFSDTDSEIEFYPKDGQGFRYKQAKNLKQKRFV